MNNNGTHSPSKSVDYFLNEEAKHEAAVRYEENKIAVLEKLHDLFPECILIYVEKDSDGHPQHEAKGNQCRVIGAMETVKAYVLRPYLDDLSVR